MKLNIEKIKEYFNKRFNSFQVRKGWLGTLENKNDYIEGMIDILDSISDAHPEMLYMIHTLRGEIEDLMDLEVEDDE